MQYNRTEEDQKLIFSFDGSITFRDADPWKEIHDSIRKTGLRKVVLDMNHVTFIDSVAFGQFILVKDICAERNLTLRLKGSSNQFNTIVSHFQINKLFEFE